MLERKIKGLEYLTNILKIISENSEKSESEQHDIVYDIWCEDEKWGYIFLPYCCYDCDGEFRFNFNDLLFYVQEALEKVVAYEKGS